MNYYLKNVIESGEYQRVQFKIGIEIKPGSYAIFSYDNDNNSSICLSSDANEDDIIIYETFDFNLFLTVKEQQYLEIDNAYIVKIEDVTDLDSQRSNMLIVGTHISEGEYKLTVLPQEDDANYSIYNSLSDFSKNELESYESFDRQNYVTLKNGQIFEYKNCSILKVGDLPETETISNEVNDSNVKSSFSVTVNGKKTDRADFVSSFKSALFEAIGNAVYDKLEEENQEKELTEYEREDYEEFENIFNNVIADYGRLLLRKQNSERLVALLSDYASKYKKIIEEIKVVVENSFVDNLLETNEENEINDLLNEQLDFLVNKNNFSEESAQIIMGMILNCFK